MKSRSRFIAVLLLTGLGACVGALGGASLAARSAPDLAADAVPAFVLQDFGGVSRNTLETNALPYKVVATALVMHEERAANVHLGRADIPALYRRFGLLYPAHVGNWPSSVPQPRFERPVGMVGHMLVGPTPLIRIDAVNLGCATCHTGALYGRDGRVTDTAWVGLPNTSVNLEAYTQTVYQSLKLALADQGALRKRIDALFPEMGTTERLTLRYLLLPRVAKRLKALAASGDTPLPFSNGGSGLTNGVAALKHIVGAPLALPTRTANVGFTSIPNLSNRALRSSLLYDGVYAPLGAQRFTPYDWARATPAHVDSLAQIVAFFTVSTMGVSPGVGEKAIPAIRPIVEWLGAQYTTPPFPGTIDSTRAAAGEQLFGQRCANCHGTYGEGRPRRLLSFPNRLVPQAAIGTDSMRWAMIDTALIGYLHRNEYAGHMTVERTGGYVAPILSGLWATAPYLHNGSVPTMWQLLTPEDRAERFYVGGHALDFANLGIDGETGPDGIFNYRPGYTPWMTPELYDTRQAGRSNRGHERQVAGLSLDEKRALIEYLKTL